MARSYRRVATGRTEWIDLLGWYRDRWNRAASLQSFCRTNLSVLSCSMSELERWNRADSESMERYGVRRRKEKLVRQKHETAIAIRDRTRLLALSPFFNLTSFNLFAAAQVRCTLAATPAVTSRLCALGCVLFHGLSFMAIACRHFVTIHSRNTLNRWLRPTAGHVSASGLFACQLNQQSPSPAER